MPEDQWDFRDGRELWPVSLRDVQVRMAHAARFYLDEYIVLFHPRRGNVFKDEVFLEFLQDGRFHSAYLRVPVIPTLRLWSSVA
jgi:hypothetical protein